MATRFTNHAFDRVRERLTLDHFEVLQILDYDLCVLLGREEETHRVHKLFYSSPDRYWFVAVQDEEDRSVVTILPLDYHHRWKISREACELARNLVLPQPMVIETVPEPSPSTGESSTPKFWFTALVNKGGSRLSLVNLGPIPETIVSTPDEFFSADILHRHLRRKLEEKIQPGQTCDLVWVRSGNGGPVVFEMCLKP